MFLNTVAEQRAMILSHRGNPFRSARAGTVYQVRVLFIYDLL